MHFFAVLIIDVMEEKMHTDFLSANSKRTYLRNSSIRIMIIKHEVVFPMLVDRGKYVGAAKTLGIMHLDNLRFSISFQEDRHFVN